MVDIRYGGYQSSIQSRVPHDHNMAFTKTGDGEVGRSAVEVTWRYITTSTIQILAALSCVIFVGCLLV